MTHPYIGITGFTNGKQVRQMAEVFDQHLAPGSDRKLMVGTMMSYKTLLGLPSKWANIYPPKESLPDIFIDHPLVINTLHFASSRDAGTAEVWWDAIDYCGPHLHAIQFDICWPRVSCVRWLRDDYPNLKTVLQIGTEAMDEVGGMPTNLWMKLRKYGSTIDYVLLDLSMGRRIPLNAQTLKPFVSVLAEHGNYKLAVAGGLGPETLPGAIEELVEIYPNLSIDAEGDMRASGDAMDPVDWNRAAEYLKLSLRVLK